MRLGFRESGGVAERRRVRVASSDALAVRLREMAQGAPRVREPVRVVRFVHTPTRGVGVLCDIVQPGVRDTDAEGELFGVHLRHGRGGSLRSQRRRRRRARERVRRRRVRH